ncbi:hemoglobinase-type cysteine proteinase [Plasmopara halstedii]|uniref:legumain n=1 Tax=Plasmopara halstedii TaxID=4781 RepID=A0A0P1A9J6_PLAHL|nr:hemoglobinase-type cysteine proteinase [Plasmopara halstedii]CEG37453.1 hemoglobinase-type cysteine proteinase [Plasmopara halstedii]|eukprot:XP_024573822.1 hemoglobinase-type cysteine proteinase [Plasmopara halstedii]
MQNYATLKAALLCAFLTLFSAQAEHWVVIVAGSKGYSNYRHQSDACHVYHVVRRHGIPAENVILMMYDDIAWHERNPYPGQLFNKPMTKNASHEDVVAVDVYKGCNIDFRGIEVTPDTFVNVLTGNSSGAFNKKVLRSTDTDRVFINFIDHGSRGNVYFPNMKPLAASRLKKAMRTMYDKKMYKELVLYVEACESGSMFSDSFLKSINAYVTTAANGFESSWATYCPPFDLVNGKSIGSCLGDLYSVNWMEDSDLTDLSNETLKTQYHRIKNETTKSHVKSFGSSQLRHEIVGNYQSTYDQNDSSTFSIEHSKTLDTTCIHDTAFRIQSAVDARDVDLVVAFYRYLRAVPGKDRRGFANELSNIVYGREASDEVFETIKVLYEQHTNMPFVSRVEEPKNLKCHDEIFRDFQTSCAFIGGFTGYALKYAGTLVDLCESNLQQGKILAIVHDACRIVNQSQRFASRNGVFDLNTVMFD